MDSNLQTLCRACNLQKGGFFEQALTPPTLHERYLPANVSQSHE
jgi:5-methylcytosine-specific restriction endonuclease McrA